ncbi:hypothetical protein [Reichenbachiella sp. MALMAid0571]|uniref:hypothetical protein n=1 Tax=Reichenbachiella sp. MALMAid0571 TaxID=3143939 RepID=UPI0032DF7644
MRKLIQLTILTLFLYGCNLGDLEIDNLKDLTYSPSVAIPIGSASYTVKELIEDIDDQEVEINEKDDLSLSIIYRDNSSFQISSDFVSFGRIENNINYNLGLIDSEPSPVSTTIPIPKTTFTLEFPEETGGDLIDSLFYLSGMLSIEVTSTFEGTVDYIATTVGTKNINSVDDFSISSTVRENITDLNQTSLSNFKTVLNSNNGKNEFEFVLEGNINIPVGARTKASDNLDIKIVISEIEISQIFGDFGLTEVTLQNQSIDLDFFEDFSSTGLALNDPKVKFEITNEYGIPIKLDLSGMTARDNNGNSVVLQGSIVDDGIEINAPTKAGETANTQIEISRANSNIQDLLNMTPTNISVPINGTTNPDGSPGPLFNNFLIDQSSIEVAATVEIPLDVKMQDFSTEIDFDIDDIDLDDAESLTIRVISTNELPLNGSVDLQILDTNGTLLHEILNQIVLKSPVVDADGRVSTPAQSTTDITLSREGIDAFINGSKILAVVHASSFDAENDTFVKIFSDYQLTFDLSLSGEITTTIDLND